MIEEVPDVKQTSNFTLNTFKIRGFDIDPSVIIQLDIFESIVMPGITGCVVIKDWQGAKELGEIFAGDDVEISWSSPDTKPINIILKVFGSYGDQVQDDQTYKTTKLHFCSSWYIDAFTRQLSKPYINKSVSEIIDDLLKECGATNYVEPTSQRLERFVTPLWTPMHSIRHLMKFAMDTQGHGGYLLFTDIISDTVICTTINKLLAGDLGYNTSEITFNAVNQVYEGNTNKLTLESNFDTIRFANQGMGKTNLIGFDFDSNKIIATNESITQYKHEHLGNYFPMLKDFESDKYSSTKFMWKSINSAFQKRHSKELEELLVGHLRTRYSHLFSDVFKINLGAPGSTLRRAGQIVKLNFPSVDYKLDPTKKDMQFDGNYLIRDIRHVFMFGDYAQAITLCSDGYKQMKRTDLMEW